MTKLHEQIFYGTLSELLPWLKKDKNHCKGEFVVLLAGHQTTSTSHNIANKKIQCEIQEMLTVFLSQLSLKQSVILTTKLNHGKKNEIYKLAMKLQTNRRGLKF